jgi:hypothetical protein
LLTELNYCREDLVVQEDFVVREDYYCCLNNLSFTVNYNLSLENVFSELYTVIHFNTSKSSRLISRPGKAGIYKQPLIQQIEHAAIRWG